MVELGEGRASPSLIDKATGEYREQGRHSSRLRGTLVVGEGENSFLVRVPSATEHVSARGLHTPLVAIADTKHAAVDHIPASVSCVRPCVGRYNVAIAPVALAFEDLFWCTFFWSRSRLGKGERRRRQRITRWEC